MKSYLIKPEGRTIEEVDYDGDYRNIYTLCGWSTFNLVRLDGGNCLAVDDEGLLTSGPLHFFLFGDHAMPLCGNALVIGPEDDEGQQLACSLTLAQIEDAVTFVTPEQAVEIHNEARRDQQSDMAVMKARGFEVIDATVGLALDEEGNARMEA